MAAIQIQIQDLIKLAHAVNNQLANIGTVLLQASETHKMQISRDIYSILKDLQNVIYKDIEE